MSAAVLAVLIAAMWALGLRYWRLHSWRTLALLLITTATLLFAGDALVAGIVKGVVWTITVVMLLVASKPLWAMRVYDGGFIDAYEEVLERLPKLRTGTDDAEAYGVKFKEVVKALETISAPSPDWAQLRDATADELRVRLALMDAGQPIAAEDLKERDRRWNELEGQFASLSRSKRSFWLIWPWADPPRAPR